MSRLRRFTFFNCARQSWVALRHNIGKRTIANALFLGGVAVSSQGFYMDAKAIIAQGLIAHSWHQRTADSPPPTPWWWADTKAIAKLEVTRLNEQVFVMQDASGESLAFGPGHLNASAGISKAGHVMIAGHRDSHFKFLQRLKIGDLIETTDHQSNIARYKIRELRILNTLTEDLIRLDQSRLTLITCYPFDGFIPGGPLRYIVDAERIDV